MRALEVELGERVYAHLTGSENARPAHIRLMAIDARGLEATDAEFYAIRERVRDRGRWYSTEESRLLSSPPESESEVRSAGVRAVTGAIVKAIPEMSGEEAIDLAQRLASERGVA